MLLPASALLLTVLVLPAIQRQWRIGAYTLGVAMLGCCLYALLQVLRRTKKISFFHNDALDAERWSVEALTLALCTFPSYLVVVVLRTAFGLSFGIAAAVGFAAGCVLACAVVITLTWALSAEDDQVNMIRDRSVLLSIPEVGEQAPLMRAFLRDSVVNSEEQLWRDPLVGSAPR